MNGGRARWIVRRTEAENVAPRRKARRDMAEGDFVGSVEVLVVERNGAEGEEGEEVEEEEAEELGV